MKKNELTYLLQHPSQINPVQTTELENVLQKFPFFQPARVLYLKALFDQNNFNYNNELKTTAAHTTNRTLLFNFITSNFFKNTSANTDKKSTESNTFVTQIKPDLVLDANNTEPIERSIKKLIDQADQKTNNLIISWDFENESPDQNKNQECISTKEEEQKIVAFNKDESHSFSQWLQLTKIKPIDRSTNEIVNSDNKKENNTSSKFDLIDKFIESNPKIGTAKPASEPINIEKSNTENSSLMTETLAKIYLDQKKYQKAIQAYEILILKYPEKSSLFAERINDIKKTQNNN